MSRLRHTIRFAAAALLATAGACGVSTDGLGIPPDAGSAGGPGICPAGLTDQAGWPAHTAATSCVRVCGPDGIGLETCGQSDRTTCQATSGCVCLETPCVRCAGCTFQTAPDCYVPTNAAAPPFCADGVSRGASCAPACDRRLCRQEDGKTGCVCNGHGKYACADWGDSGWK